MTKFVIVGGGHAAAQAVTSLRQKKFEGDVTLISDEAIVPYQRPPLSKAYLAGELTQERLPILRESAYQSAGVALRLNTRAEAINRAAKTVTLSDGENMPFDKLLLATGGHARRLDCEGTALKGIHYVRTIKDTDDLKPAFNDAEKIVIVGGGYVGLEIAAVARKAGKAVTVLEAEDRLLARVVAPEVSAFYRTLHEEEGVQVCTNQAVTRFLGEAKVEAVETATGDRFSADVVVVGVGLIANTELAKDAGLETTPHGIFVNEHCQTSDPNIYAAGDVTWHYNSFFDQNLRIESVQNATDQAKVAIGHMLGEDITYNSLPWFWSDQYGLKLQIAGLSAGYEKIVMRGNPTERSVCFFYLKDNKIIAADSVGRIAEFMNAKKLISGAITVDEAVLIDDSRPFKEITNDLLCR